MRTEAALFRGLIHCSLFWLPCTHGVFFSPIVDILKKHPIGVRIDLSFLYRHTPTIVFLSLTAHKPTQGLVCCPFRRKPLVGVPGSCSPRPACYHSNIYGPADHCCDCKQEGAQTKGKRTASKGMLGNVASLLIYK